MSFYRLKHNKFFLSIKVMKFPMSFIVSERLKVFKAFQASKKTKLLKPLISL